MEGRYLLRKLGQACRFVDREQVTYTIGVTNRDVENLNLLAPRLKPPELFEWLRLGLDEDPAPPEHPEGLSKWVVS